MSFTNRNVHLTCERFRGDHAFNKPPPVQSCYLSLPYICTYHPQFKYNLFSLILSNHIPRSFTPSCEILLGNNQTYCHCWKKSNRRLHWLKNILKIAVCCYHFKNRTKLELGSWECSFDPVSYGSSKERQLWTEWWSSYLMFHVRPSVPYHRSFLIARGRDVSDPAASSWRANCRLHVSL